jgi:hypothetical protein
MLPVSYRGIVDNHSFVIRLWQETANAAESEPIWRGHAIHYPSKQELYFDDFALILVFINACIDVDDNKIVQVKS